MKFPGSLCSDNATLHALLDRSNAIALDAGRAIAKVRPLTCVWNERGAIQESFVVHNPKRIDETALFGGGSG